MRTFLFFAVLFGMFIFALTAAVRPDMIEKEYNRIKEPVEKHFAEKRAEAWRQAKEKEWQAWAKQIRLPADCSNARAELRKLECKNQWELQANTFERRWANKVASGWKPDSVD